MRFLVRLLVTGAAVGVATWLLADITVTGTSTQRVLTILAVGGILGVINAVVRPIVRLLALPLYLFTLGLVTFVINALMLLLADAVAGGLGLHFQVKGFWTALWGALIISVVSFLLSWLVPDKDDARRRSRR